MKQIKVSKNIEFLFTKKYMYVENTYILDSNIKFLEDINRLFKIDLKNHPDINDKYIYINDDGKFIEVDSAFKSIYGLGKDLFNKLNFNKITDIDPENETVFHDKIIKIIFEWILINGHPFSHFSFDETFFLPKDALMQFAYDSLFLYITYEIVALSNTLKKFYEEKFLDELKKYISFLDIKTIIKGNEKYYGIWKEIIEMDFQDFNINDDIDNDLNYLDTFNNVEELDKYLTTINKLLTLIMAHTVKSREYDFLITSQKPFFNDLVNSFILVDTCQSIVGVAYSQLFLIIATNDQYAHRCHNPNCSSIITGESTKNFCSKRCRTYGNNAKSARCYKEKKIKKSNKESS